MSEDAEKKIDFIVCTRVVDLTEPRIENSTKEHCSLCKSEVWISPGTLEVKARTGVEVICTPCALVKLKHDENPQIVVTPGQIKEATEQIKKDIRRN